MRRRCGVCGGPLPNNKFKTCPKCTATLARLRRRPAPVRRDEVSEREIVEIYLAKRATATRVARRIAGRDAEDAVQSAAEALIRRRSYLWHRGVGRLLAYFWTTVRGEARRARRRQVQCGVPLPPAIVAAIADDARGAERGRRRFDPGARLPAPVAPAGG
jgi:DNA-directed RNA polymerase specialized sigma24 family protein